MIAYSIAGYRNKLRTTRNKVLLVEGLNDKRVFLRLIQESAESPDISSGIFIDTAAIIESPDSKNPLGNRDKVISVCAGIGDEENFTAFVDREFHEFYEHDGEIIDKLNDHYVNGCLVWSRGHSIENYCFDLNTLREPLRDFSVTDSFDRALDLFEEAFSSAVRVAAALSLTGRDVSYLHPVKCSINWKLLNITTDTVILNNDEWFNVLSKRIKFKKDIAIDIIKRFNNWLGILSNTNIDTLRWLCHGHIGLVVFWSVYARCVFLATDNNEAEACRVLAAEESVRFNVCIESWIRKAINENVDSPKIVLEKLGIKVS